MYSTEASVQELVKFFTKRHFNLTRQGQIYRQDPKLYETLKAKGREVDRTFDEKLRSINEQIAALQEQRKQLIHRGFLG